MEKKMGNSIKFFIILFLAFALYGCSSTDKAENSAKEPAQKGMEEMEGIDFGDVTRNAYFLDNETIFSANVPENWHDKLMPGGDSTPRIRFTCIDSESDGFQNTNFFYLDLKSIPDGRNYPKYKKTTFEFLDGQKSIRHTREYEDEFLDGYRYYADVLVMPGWNYALSSSEDRDPYLTVERYKRNREQIEAFYNSILYQERAEYVGREVTGNLAGCERIRVHFQNEYLNIEMVVPEGIAYETGMADYGWERDEFRLRFYLDGEKRNYVEMYSDLTGRCSEWIVTTNGYQADLVDGGELMYYMEWESGVFLGSEWRGEEYRQITCTFPGNRTGAAICVEKENEELYGLALDIVKSVRFK